MDHARVPKAEQVSQRKRARKRITGKGDSGKRGRSDDGGKGGGLTMGDMISFFLSFTKRDNSCQTNIVLRGTVLAILKKGRSFPPLGVKGEVLRWGTKLPIF